jgi:UDP-N-acetylmuramate--alanine ligase
MLLGPLTQRVRNIHMIGIGGAGMNGIAEILIDLGFNVTGSDMRRTPVTDRLATLGAKIFIGHDPANVEKCDVVVYSSAVKEDNPEIIAARERKIPVIKRPEMLGELMRLKYGICIAGTHGKTSTTSMTGQILAKGGIDPTIIVGGKVTGFGGGAKIGHSHYLVLEADEYDRTFLNLTPVIAVVTNIDLEHLDCYKDLDDIKACFLQFVNKVPFFGTIIVCIDDPGVQSVLPDIKKRVVTYGISRQAELRAENTVSKGIVSTFDVIHKDVKLGQVKLNVPGLHNVRNALAAIAVSIEMGVDFKTIVDGLNEYRNVERRFQIIGEEAGVMVVDDYAHHPTEVAASLEALRSGFGRRIVAVFQPHLYSRTRDFAGDFGRAFMESDILIVTDVYPSRETPIPGITGKIVADSAKAAGHRNVIYIEDKNEIVKSLSEIALTGDIVITFGAGDINKTGYDFLEILRNKL